LRSGGRVNRDAGVVVTGVSSGIGAAIMWELLGAGYQVFGTVRRARDTGAVQAAGGFPIIMDVTLRTSVLRAQETVARALDGRPLAGLVNNAGVPGVGPVELIDLDELRQVFEVNVFGVVSVTQVFLPMLRASRGRVINISSVSGRLALPFAGSYAASKFALEGFSDSLRRELVGTGVDVVVIQPGSVRSSIWAKTAAIEMTAVRGTIYERAIGRLRQLAQRSAETAAPAESVARAVVRSLTRKKPPTRVRVVRGGWRRGFLKFLPDRWVDRMISRRIS
jgi:NAD(P)-dependent dehydrogenase (short-subunit alcohol dehydrogenase family)